MEALDRLGTLSAGPRWLPGISLNLGLVLLVCCCMHSNFAVMASWHGMICVSSTTVWSQRGKLGYLAIFALPHFLPHTKFYHTLPHSTTFIRILPQEDMTCDIYDTIIAMCSIGFFRKGNGCIRISNVDMHSDFLEVTPKS
jgi:hypothetical protein